MEREIDLCLLGVRHDAVELLIEKALLSEEDRPDELTFFEFAIRETGHHLNLESDMIAAMQYVFSLLVLHLVPQTSFVQLGHNDDEKEKVEFFQWYAKKWHLPLHFFLAMSVTERRLFLIVSLIYRDSIAFIQRSHGDLVGSWLGDFFGQNKKAAETYAALLLEMMRTLKSNNTDYVRLNGNTITHIHRFAQEVCDLFVKYEGQLGSDLDVVATMLSEFQQTGQLPQDFAKRTIFAAANVRDRLSMDRVANVLKKRTDIKRVILVVGYLHIPKLTEVAHDYNGLLFRVTNIIASDPADRVITVLSQTNLKLMEDVLAKIELWRATSS